MPAYLKHVRTHPFNDRSEIAFSISCQEPILLQLGECGQRGFTGEKMLTLIVHTKCIGLAGTVHLNRI